MQPCYNSTVHRTRTGERLYWKINRIKPYSSVLSSWLQFCQLYGHPQFQIPQYNLKRNNFVSKFHEWLLMNLLWATNSYKWATTTFFYPLPRGLTATFNVWKWFKLNTIRQWYWIITWLNPWKRWCKQWKKLWPSISIDWLININQSRIGPLQLAIHMVQNHHTGEQKLHWEKTNKRHT